MIIELDDDDTTPTENVDVLAELARTLSGTRLAITSSGAATSAGLRRELNEDAWGARDGTFVVTDGMGGHGGGALAARVAIDRFLQRVPATGDVDWRAVVEAVNTDVIEAGRTHAVERLGCTLLAVTLTGPVVTVVHVGDSRAYRLTIDTATARLDLLTHDHDVRSELLAAGLDVGEYRDRGVALHGLTSYIGLEHEALRIDVLAVPVRAGDRLLLCTDGVYRQLPDERLRQELRAPTCHDAATRLVRLADELGGRDNATALVAEIGVRPAPADGRPSV